MQQQLQVYPIPTLKYTAQHLKEKSILLKKLDNFQKKKKKRRRKKKEEKRGEEERRGRERDKERVRERRCKPLLKLVNR